MNILKSREFEHAMQEDELLKKQLKTDELERKFKEHVKACILDKYDAEQWIEDGLSGKFNL